MNLRFTCKNCKAYSKLKENVHSRMELADIKGASEFNIQCSECLSTVKIHVNSVYADTDKSRNLLYVGITLAAAVAITLLFWNKGYISTLSFALPAVIYVYLSKNQQDDVREFNKWRK